MKLQDIKTLRRYSERFWTLNNPTKQGRRGILIENDISGTFESESIHLGSRVKRFKPWTHKSLWSSWRVGIPVKWKGKSLILWVRAYHCDKGDPILWMEESIWCIKSNKELRKDASRNCWAYIRAKAQECNLDISDIKAKRIDPTDITKGWMVIHNGETWTIEPNISMTDPSKSSGYWIRYGTSTIFASLRDSVKDAKAFIKYDSGEWLSNRKF